MSTNFSFTNLHIISPKTDFEWKAARLFRQKYFFDRVPMDDPYMWTFNHPQHVHFVVYIGTNIIGYAHIQLWPDDRAALRIIVIDESYRNKGYGTKFLKFCEKWLSQQNIKKLLVQSRPEAYQFYYKNGYIEMPFNDPDGHETHPDDIEVGKDLI